MIRRLEELSANAWPGLRSALVDGWIIRFAEGYSSRANSVLPLYPGQTALPERIVHCEALALSRGADTIFKLTAAALPAGLDAELERRGYAHVADTSVMVLERLTIKETRHSDQLQIQVFEHLDEAWFAFYASSGGLNEQQAQAARAIMGHIVPRCRFLLMEGEDGPVACALTVLEDGWAGVFDVAVRKELRGRGLGRRIMECTLAEAAAGGAHRSYLQVLQGNQPAERLYQQLGYKVAYPYWYRVQKRLP
jgi:GNAT superfamily N-acetyltransferase